MSDGQSSMPPTPEWTGGTNAAASSDGVDARDDEAIGTAISTAIGVATDDAISADTGDATSVAISAATSPERRRLCSALTSAAACDQLGSPRRHDSDGIGLVENRIDK